jgi:Tol biopolymer transport system component
LKEGGGRLDWVDEKIAFDMRDAREIFEIHVMKPDGSEVKCVTCDRPDLPKGHKGQPAWHPSGRYLVFQAEKEKHRKVRFEHILTPGGGVLNDLWVLDTETNRATRIREVEDDAGEGTLHPHFSKDGRMLSWSEMVEGGGLKKGKELGYWELMVADFSDSGGKPSLARVRSFAPGGKAFYENHGFSPDGSQLIFTSSFEAKSRLDSNIYVMDIATEKLMRMTDEGWNEHAHYSPDGRFIVWMSNRGLSSRGAEYWIMDSDGSNKRRLTYFNEKGHPQYVGPNTMVADFSWRPDGKAFGAYTGGKVITASTAEKILLIEIDPAR